VLPEEEEGRGEDEEGDPELFGGLEEEAGLREEAEDPVELVGPIGRELASSICFCSSGVNCPVIPVNANLADKAKAGY